MTTRKNFEMTADDLATLLESMQPVPMMMLQCGTPPSTQERANAAWAALGKKYGFDGMTVQPTGRGDRFFSAMSIEPKPHLQMDGDKWMATWPDFINLAKSPGGFGDTHAEAIADLKRQTAALQPSGASQ